MEEKTDGAYIAFIENKIPEMYGGVERLSLLLAVANCLNRGLKNFKITGVAINDSHAIHYLAGMRFGKFDNRYRAEKAKRWFGTSDINKIIKTIIENTPAGSKYCTSMLGCINMHLLQSVIKSITEYLKKHPVLF